MFFYPCTVWERMLSGICRLAAFATGLALLIVVAAGLKPPNIFLGLGVASAFTLFLLSWMWDYAWTLDTYYLQLRRAKWYMIHLPTILYGGMCMSVVSLYTLLSFL